MDRLPNDVLKLILEMVVITTFDLSWIQVCKRWKIIFDSLPHRKLMYHLCFQFVPLQDNFGALYHSNLNSDQILAFYYVDPNNRIEQPCYELDEICKRYSQRPMYMYSHSTLPVYKVVVHALSYCLFTNNLHLATILFREIIEPHFTPNIYYAVKPMINSQFCGKKHTSPLYINAVKWLKRFMPMVV